MSDLISREAAKQAIRDRFPDFGDRVEINAVLNGLPAADAAPVVHGWWITYPECLEYEGAFLDEHIVCSCCKSVWNIIDNDTDRFDYCPSCGAKMEVETDDTN